MTQRLVLVTRPLAQAESFSRIVEHSGGQAVLCPLTEIHSIAFDAQAVTLPDAILVTSQQVFAHGGDLSRFYSVPVYCVGAATAEAARVEGFYEVIECSGDVVALCGRVLQGIPAKSKLLYLRGENVRMDLSRLLPDYDIDQHIVYKAEAVTRLSDDVVDIFSQLDVICLFSARSGAILGHLMQQHHLAGAEKTINLLSLSEAVLESVSDLNWKATYVADRPDVEAMGAKLKRVLEHHD